MLWQIYVYPQPGQPDLEASRVADEVRELRIGPVGDIRSARGYLIEGNLQRQDVERLGREVLADPVTESFRTNDEELIHPAMEDVRIDFVIGEGIGARTINMPLRRLTGDSPTHLVDSQVTTHHSPLTTHSVTLANVLLEPGVMDPVAQSVEQAIAQF